MIEKDINIDTIKEYLNADPSLLSDLDNIYEYRKLRIEQTYYGHLASEYDHEDIMKQSKIVRNAGYMQRMTWGTNVEKCESRRRKAHNRALTSFNSILRTGKLKELPQIYEGKTLTNEEIKNYLRAERREEITDSMFELLYIIENGIIEKEITNENKGLQDLKYKMNQDNRTFGIYKTILKDESDEKDGGIEFDFSGVENDKEIRFDFSALDNNEENN